MVGSARNPLLVLVFAFAASGLLVGQSQDQPSPPSQPEATSQPLPERVRVSDGVTAGLLLNKVPPKYPKAARKKHLQGTVIMTAIIDKNGNIVDLTLVSGDPILAKSAMDAVKQWKYRPYLLQGHPVEVETHIQVNFTLAGG